MPPLWRVKGRFPTLKANPYLISMHQCFLFLFRTSHYKALCLLLAEKSFDLARVIPTLLIFSAKRFWSFRTLVFEHFKGHGYTIEAVQLPIIYFFSILTFLLAIKLRIFWNYWLIGVRTCRRCNVRIIHSVNFIISLCFMYEDLVRICILQILLTLENSLKTLLSSFLPENPEKMVWNER